MVVDVGKVLRTQLVTVVVDLVLDVKRAGSIEILFMTFEQHVHLRERIVDELEHLMDVVILVLVEVFL